MLEAVQVRKLKLSDVRGQLQLTQRGLARIAGVSPMVISNAENRYPIRRLSAHAILNVVNPLRIDLGLDPLTIDQIDWVISGDGGDEDKK